MDIGNAFDDDGRPKRTGTMYTASAHIVTAVIGSGVLSLAWAMAQLGWLVGSIALLIFAMITLFTSMLLTDCYRHPDPVTGKRNYTYMEAVRSNLGPAQVWFCGLCQYVNLCGTAIGYTITTAVSAAALTKSSCFHNKGHDADCTVKTSYYMIGFGVVEVVLSQLPDIHEIWWLSVVAAVMSLAYSFIAIGLCIAKMISGDTGKTTLIGTEVGVDVDAAQKVWRAFQALGDIAFAYSYSMILIEIQDTLKSSPPENKVMKKASLLGVLMTSTFYLLCGFLGYATFGNQAPGNILTGFGFYEPFWLIDIANICIIIHLVGAFQVFVQPVFFVAERRIAASLPNQGVLVRDRTVRIGKSFTYKFKLLQLGFRTIFVILSTFLGIMLPFFNDVLALLGAVAFWPLTVYFPLEMYMAQRKIKRGSFKGILMLIMNVLCFLVSLSAASGAIEGVVHSFKDFTPFSTKS